ncbi:small redox-active disulfide protein 2 [Litoreibacter ascidiaceicola]|uniref:Small redox-active disulfide protein 2 n=1 Tax=Litoreibacter ascidiaceicola TaxID=1486859 RepID=A0A1M4T9H5_9RHOB|nr:thioredoxin family protein [Litoreibacter ascidiaceicola]SHE41133.1 small redox-active disulfide protein 2 [Litoreibacter ascidiaceicola]
MIIKILGSGCKKCAALEENAKAAAKTAAINADIEKVTDIVAIAGYGVMSTPGLVIDEKVVASGRVLSASEIGALLQES